MLTLDQIGPVICNAQLFLCRCLQEAKQALLNRQIDLTWTIDAVFQILVSFDHVVVDLTSRPVEAGLQCNHHLFVGHS